MKNSKETRTCVGCREKKNKKELVRIVNSKEQGIIVDFNQREQERGAYICKSEECLKKAMKNKGLSRTLKVNVSDEKFNEIRGVMFD